MPLKLTRRAPGWDGNIVAGNTVTLRLPIGLSYHQVDTEYSFVDGNGDPVDLANAVAEIRVLKNGKPTWNIQAGELDIVNQFQSRQAANGILCIDFDRYNLRSRPAEEFTTVGTGHPEDPSPLTTFTIEMDIKAGVASGSLSSRLRQSAPRPLGVFKKLRRYTHTFGGAGVHEIADYPRGDLINCMYWFESANNIDHVKIERDNTVIFDRSTAYNSRVQTDGVRSPQSNLYVYDTSEDGNGTDQLVTRNVSDLRFFFTLDGAMTITTLIEYLGVLEN